MHFKYFAVAIAAATSCSALVIPRQITDQALVDCLVDLATLKTNIDDMTKLVTNWGGSGDLLGALNIQSAGTAVDTQCKKTTENILKSGPFTTADASQAIAKATLDLAPSSTASLSALLDKKSEFKKIPAMFGAMDAIRKQLATQNETNVKFQEAVRLNVLEESLPALAEAAKSVNDKYAETVKAYTDAA